MRAAAIKNAIVAAIVLSLGMAASTTLADESPDLSQAPGEHSTLSTSDGKIRDDELVDYIVEQIILNGGKVKDVKIVVNCCFGAGLLDEFERAFGPGGPLEGTPWVAGAASEADQRARGWSDAKVAEFPSGGSTYTDAVFGPATSPSDALPGTARDPSTPNVKEDLETAGIFDYAGSCGRGLEDAVTAWGNGGENITWNGAGGGHQAVVFGGKQNRQRHHNNINNTKEALEGLWSGDPHTIRDIDGGTTQDLKNAIAAACQNLDENTQLLLYFDDHGGTTFDIGEFLGWLVPHTVSSYFEVVFSLHDGWKEAMQGMLNAGQIPTPTLNMILNQPMDTAEWSFWFNGLPLLLPPGPLSGLVQVAVPALMIKAGDNKLELVPKDSSSQPIEFDGLAVDAGDVEDGEMTDMADAVRILRFLFDGFHHGGATVHDVSSNGHHGTIYGDPTLVQGVSGGAFDFDGVDDFIDVDKTLEEVGVAPGGPFSLTGWVNTRSFNGGVPFNGGSFGLRTRSTESSWRVERWGHPTYDFEFMYGAANEWVHFAITDSGAAGGDQMIVYGDGWPVGRFDMPLGEEDIGPIRLAGRNGSDHFDGIIDEFAIWDRALTREEIVPLANPPLDFGQGGVGMEVFQDIGGTAVADLTGHPDYQAGDWSWAAKMDDSQSPVNLDDNYGARLSGWLMPETSGDYTFWISSDDASELWLSTTADPADTVLIASVSGWASAGEYDEYLEQQSAAIPLVGGQPYYIEALYKEGGGGDHCQVAFRGPGISERSIIPGDLLIPKLPANGIACEVFSYNPTTFDGSNWASVLENGMFSFYLPTINQDWEWGSLNDYAPEDNFAVWSVGCVEVPTTGEYTWYGRADDNVMIWIGDELVIDTRDSPRGTEVASEPIQLPEGMHRIRTLMWEGGGPANWRVSWEGPDIPKEIIPREAFSPPDFVHSLRPADGAVNVDRNVSVTWSPGVGAKLHYVYFGTDGGSLPLVAIKDLGDEEYDPGPLDLGQTYLWQVIEKMWDETIIPGQVSSFTVADYINIDNMEGYTDENGKRIFDGDGWTDGQGTEDKLGNFTGSEVGIDHIIVYGGRQSMLFNYDNTGWMSFFTYSQADKEFDPPLGLSNTDAVTAYFRGPEDAGASNHSERSDIYTITAAGSDIWGNSDQFHFAYQEMTGDFDIRAEVTSITRVPTGYANSWAKGGVMMRETLDADSIFAATYGSPGHGAAFQGRTNTGGGCYNANNPDISIPHWVRLVRAGETITGYHSLNGTNWNGWVMNYPGLEPAVYVGLALTSRDPASTAQATFKDVTVDGGQFVPTANKDIGIVPNDPNEVSLGIVDTSGNEFVQPHPDPAATLLSEWTLLTLDMGAAADAGVNVGETAKIFVRVGNKDDPTPGGEGTIWLDDLREHPKAPEPKKVSLDISSSGAGSVTDPGEGTLTYDEGEEVTVVATPDPSGGFIRWEGPVVDPTSPTTTVIMDDNCTVKAVFDVVRIDAVVVPDGTDLPPTTEELPESWPTFAVGEAVGIGVYAMITDPKCEFALAAVYADVTCPEAIVSCDSVEPGPHFGVLASGTIVDGLVDELGGCADETGHGNKEHVLIATVKATVTGVGQGEVSCSAGDTGCAIGAYGRVADEEVSCYVCPIEGVADCTCPYDLNGDCYIDGQDLDQVGCCFGLLGGDYGCEGSVECTTCDFDCDGEIGVGDWAFFFTAFGCPWNDPGIVYSECAGGTPCGQEPLLPGGFVASDVAVRSLIVASPSASDSTEALPASISSVSQGEDYYVEVWASDVGRTNTGLTSVYVDVDLGPGGSASIESVDHSEAFGVLPSGTITTGGIEDLGGSSLAAAGVGPQWARVASVKMRAETWGPVSCSLAPSATGVAAMGRGLVPWSRIELGSGDECFPADYSTYNDWLSLGKPDCWCMPYQCDGDADGGTETLFEYRIYDKDLNLIVENWRRKVDDLLLDPCADIDHKSETFFDYRVYGKDLAMVVTNWKKKDADLAGDCPRPE